MKTQKSWLIVGAVMILAAREAHAQNGTCASLPQGAQRRMFPSAYMSNSAWPFVIWLPPDYAVSTRNYPVVYFLHGRTDNECTQVSGLVPHVKSAIASGAITPMIYVFVNGGAQCNFADNVPACPQQAAESYIMKELIPYIDKNYRTIASREGRAIEGFSMGGGASLRYLFAYPDRFCDAMAYAGDASPTPSEQAQGLLKDKTRVRMTVGTSDTDHIGSSRSEDRILTSFGVPHEYEEVQGIGHNVYQLYAAMNGMVGLRGLALHSNCFAVDDDGGTVRDASAADAPASDGAARDTGVTAPPATDSGPPDAAGQAAGNGGAGMGRVGDSGMTGDSARAGSGGAAGSAGSHAGQAGAPQVTDVGAGGCSCSTARTSQHDVSRYAPLVLALAIGKRRRKAVQPATPRDTRTPEEI